MIYLGTPGRMVGIKCPASQQVQSADRYSFRSTLEGRVKAQVVPGGRRVWGLQTSGATTPSEHSLLSQFASGAWGRGPFQLLSMDALVSNMITPAASLLLPGEFVLTSGVSATEGAPMLTPDGWAARSLIKNTANGLFLGADQVPLVPGGKPVTVSAYVRGSGGAVGVAWYNSAGASISTVYSSVTAGASNVVRSWITAVPPSGAVSFRVVVNSATVQACWPAVTLTDSLQPFGEGQGCVKAVVSTMSRDQVLAAPGSTYSSVSFTITEVG